MHSNEDPAQPKITNYLNKIIKKNEGRVSRPCSSQMEIEREHRDIEEA